MGKNLVVEDGRVVYGHAVARLAESLSPLGAAARVWAETCACITEMRQLGVESRRIDADKADRLASLEDRRVAVAGTLRAMHDRVGQAELNARGLRKTLDNIQKALTARDVPADEKPMYLEALRVCTSELRMQHAEHGDELVRSIDTVLNGDGAPTTSAQRAGRKPQGGQNRKKGRR